eukprot:CAMPEP_0117022988 /NCGR_PEP_ID=MMETSP0472-20121206/17208_1 /TAXON_ID=693140 ORGANISM="Tiarina fusus, Strain LIS" /NCGR_SAMPLE_ID=MMETSP0472 /ASSEMBLY_ACC=CAM_ASM_000603 /LENGTH=72 /DNA_ID=CAMNT_0004728987 /DNA_START=85 /DNA_END=300 /DNA_ORIENTATION=+
MGAGASNPAAQMMAKNQAQGAVDQAKEGMNSLTGAKTDKEKEQEQRGKDRIAEYEQKKKEREERKKKLANQW